METEPAPQHLPPLPLPGQRPQGRFYFLGGAPCWVDPPGLGGSGEPTCSRAPRYPRIWPLLTCPHGLCMPDPSPSEPLLGSVYICPFAGRVLGASCTPQPSARVGRGPSAMAGPRSPRLCHSSLLRKVLQDSLPLLEAPASRVGRAEVSADVTGYGCPFKQDGHRTAAQAQKVNGELDPGPRSIQTTPCHSQVT